MQNYTFDIINAKFVAAGAAIQAKGLAYRLSPNVGRDAMRQNDYHFDKTSGGLTLRNHSEHGLSTINRGEEGWTGASDYWLGRTALTDLVIKVPSEGDLLINDITMNVSLQKEVVKTAWSRMISH